MTRAITSTLAAAFLLAVTGLLGACDAIGGADPEDDATEAASREDAMLEFAECMRENGVPMEDPAPGEPGLMINGEGVDPETVQAAQEECQHLIEAALPGEGEMEMPQEDREALLAQAQCMREHGWDVPDPQFDGGRVTQRLEGGVDPGDPEFQADQEECAAESGVDLPQMGGEGS